MTVDIEFIVLYNEKNKEQKQVNISKAIEEAIVDGNAWHIEDEKSFYRILFPNATKEQLKKYSDIANIN